MALAFAQGWTDVALLARACGINPPAIRNLALGCPPEWLAAAALCLGDDRLLIR
ncbi:MAG: hypothetical protein JRI68_29970 [Deltaproteobacteria bacterium]|nr:hypothetical protein [Deltaproteobacteria bacterium]